MVGLEVENYPKGWKMTELGWRTDIGDDYASAGEKVHKADFEEAENFSKISALSTN